MVTRQQERVRRSVRYNHDRLFYAGGEGILEIPILKGGAGSYPDAPSRRMAVDDDGSLLIRRTNFGVPGVQGAANRSESNDEDNVVVAFSNNNDEEWGWFFPELREVDGVFLAFERSSNGVYNFRTSVDTTNTIDGTHVQQTSNYPESTSSYPTEYRNAITSYALSGIRYAYWRTTDQQNDGFLAFHIYGTFGSGQTPDRLLWFDQATALEYSKPLDYGDAPRGSHVDTVTFIKNNSGSLTASTVQVTAESLYLNSGAWYTFSEGGSYQATLSLASSIANGANSPNITIRRIIPDAELVGLHAGRTFVSVGSWA